METKHWKEKYKTFLKSYEYLSYIYNVKHNVHNIHVPTNQLKN